ncbi:MAG: recombinase family protein [Sphingobacteriales bacterium 39-19]|nr:recombinase family protein [Sphingobacteriales bacterium]OJW10481.1 MAG: recombinase family protein [Sphingobacteriales bacterium 39-19]
MKIADLYIRVSTDEQADKGYSQRDQEERLRRYCNINNIQIRKVIFEDHSAKTFRRPAWQNLLVDLRKQRGHSDLILFTKWDRFSRNAGDAYQMISLLRHLGVEPQAVEQPLDLSIPENKMMLAFYLAAPEVENDRRALNVFNGMRRAKKEGRWMGTAPIGYLNRITEDGKKYIAPKDQDAKIMKWAFEEIFRNKLNTEQVWKQAREKGLKCSKNNFWVAIRNPIYCGLIFVPQHKDEQSQLVPGQHEPIITTTLFFDVQDVLDGRKRKAVSKKVVSQDDIPLRGYLICPNCGRFLTGSGSKGRKKYYHYYHCSSECGVRYKADDANNLMIDAIGEEVRNVPQLKLFREIIAATYMDVNRVEKTDQKRMMSQLDQIKHRLSKARELLLREEIEGEDYRTIKTEASERIADIEAKLKASNSFSDSMELLWDLPISKVSHLDILFQNGTVIQKRKIVSTMFPDNLIYDGVKLHRTRVSAAISLLTTRRKCPQEAVANSNQTYRAESVHLNRKHAVTALRNRM